MSLLLDALKKAGQERAASTAEGLPGSAASPNDPTNYDPARAAVKKLFSAKAAPAHGRLQIGIIPMALAGGIVLASVGGLYVWYQMSAYTPKVAPHRPAAAVVAQTTPSPQLLAPQPARVLPAIEPQVAEPAVPDIAETPPPAAMTAAPARAETRIHIYSRKQANRIDPMLSTAYQAYRQGDYATAEQQYVAVLKQDSKNRDALLGMAGIAQQQGADEIAAQYYQRVLTLDPRDPIAYAGMAGLIQQDDAPGEESRLKLLLAQQPESAPLNFALGNLYSGQQRWPEAQQAYFNAYSQQSDSAEYAYNLAVSLDHLGQLKAATNYYQRALQLDPSGTAGFDRKLVAQRLNALKAD